MTHTTAAFYTGGRTVTAGEAPVAAPGPGEVTVDVAYTGICGTDLHIFHGDMDSRVALPAIIGHEMSGRISATGEGVEGWAPGDAVTVMPLRWCGDCPACHAGNSHICHRLDFVGIDSPGSLRGRWTVPAGLLVRLPRDLPLDRAALVEPTAVAVHDVRRGGVAAGEKVLVVGGGPVGLLIASVAAGAGADVLLAELDPRRRAFAAELGLRTVDAAGDVAARVQEWSGGAGADVAFEVSGAADGMTTAVEALSVRGRLVLVAIHGRPRTVDLHRFFWRELTLVGARLYDRSDFERAVELVAEEAVPAARLISTVVPLAEAASGFAALEGGGAGEMKVLVDCTASGA
ncbi:Zn-dependent alcohol dehydrogenase [Streptomyces daqingensis]|uniref:2-deoxy-scyllo-inosamine dehydrogenase n=1 Tax=Streptomyces daqingensis TaxID=1472640 RepID=A0ABQ2M0U7_9ACTN|nr:alcohol dehydrogenase catalytic domain-containing protein [Streptomyces daqingensis]GGO45489.1 Zn-dependent alcohol dehydrogenase [Streptomyces daqingensis]